MSVWAETPKVELHLHLEGAAPPDFIRELAAEQGVTLEGIFNADGSYKWSDFTTFLETYHAASSVLKSPGEYGRLTEVVLEKSAADGVIYTEIFLSPDICGGGDQAAWIDYLEAIYEGAEAAHRATGIVVRFVPVCIRNFGPEKAERAARLAINAMGPKLTGFGMAGEERVLSAADFVKPFAMAKEAGLGITSHAGELAGAASVRETLDHLPVSRIGHGVRVIEDISLVQRLADEGVVLEVNPGSNVALEVFPSWADHPIEKLRQAGVKVTVSTDDPPYFHTDMVAEYDNLAETFGWDQEVFREINIVAMNAAFCDAETRREIIAKLNGTSP